VWARYWHWLLLYPPGPLPPLYARTEHAREALAALDGREPRERIERFLKLARCGCAGPDHVLLGGRPHPLDLVRTALEGLAEGGAILLAGPPGTGKTALAVDLCRWLDPLSCGVYVEADIIPRHFGENLVRRALGRHHCVVLDDLYLLARPRSITAGQAGLAVVADVQAQVLDAAELARERGVLIVATTNLRPEHVDWALLSRLRPVHVGPPPPGWWDVLGSHGYKVVRHDALTYREALYGTERPVADLRPAGCARPVARGEALKLEAAGAYRLVLRLREIPCPVPYELYPAVAARLACGRPAVWVRRPGAVEYLAYYSRPVAVLPPALGPRELLQVAHEYGATVLAPTAEEPLDAPEAARQACPGVEREWDCGSAIARMRECAASWRES
jgi:DNA polymerase III delta prime subunit